MPLLDLPDYLLLDARLYAPGRDNQQAVAHILQDYPRLVAELRLLRRRVAQIEEEGTALDARLEALQSLCRSILDL